MSRVFDENTVARLRALRLALRRAFAGDRGTAERALGLGGRSEFREHRGYVPGDDWRTLDWNLFGRLEELFVKVHEDRADLEIVVVLDRSGSMGLGSPSKDVAARRIAAGLAFGLAGEGRSVRVLGLGLDLQEIGPSVRGEAEAGPLLGALESLPEVSGRADWHRLRPLFAAGRRPRVVVVLGDLLDPVDPIAALGGPRSGKVEGRLLILQAREDRSPDPGGAVVLEGAEGEGGLRLVLDADAVARYRAVFDRHVEDLLRRARGRGLGARVVRSETPFERVLLEDLAGAEARR